MQGTGEEAGRCLTAERGRVLAPGWQPEPGKSSWIQSGLEDLVSANKWGVLCQSEDPVLDLAPKLFATHKAASGGTLQRPVGLHRAQGGGWPGLCCRDLTQRSL